jgi:hypothetical protein
VLIYFVSKDEPVRIFRIKNKANQRYLGTKYSFVPVAKYTFRGEIKLDPNSSVDSPENLWEVRRVRKSVYRFKNYRQGFYLSSNATAAIFLDETAKNDPFQEWQFLKDSDEVVNRGNGLRLTLESKTKSLIAVSPFFDENADVLSQKWELIPIIDDPFINKTALVDIFGREIPVTDNSIDDLKNKSIIS